ncbi:ISNCY family transposase [Arachidicoccus soli]|uniref:ISNCY family transposase n=1 Tax=Arachidicoccus soli TaxID=2341117 RepID=A0A386HP51_9BACT|nr:ISNCY family transposase [Arachidicoccus soli]AYD47270.1 ISNCY family transposase [Arachidicoccus soli]
MRQRFEQQLSLRMTPIAEVKFPLKSRDEMPPILKALQYIFITPQLNEQVFAILEDSICKGKRKTGRKGMDLWHILVLGVVRHAQGTNWDKLQYIANFDMLVRKVMGVHKSAFTEDEDEEEFNYQTILDNVSLLDEDTLIEINKLIVEAGYSLLKKKEEEALRLKTDSYAVETNVHFPTDLNLLWDSMRKCLDMIVKLREETPLKGWRKIKSLRQQLKTTFRATSFQVFKGKKEANKRASVQKYLAQAGMLVAKVDEVIADDSLAVSPLAIALVGELKRYRQYAVKQIDLIDRRLLKAEVIPATEKVHSIFEEHTEWLAKGKQNKKVELGHLLLITTDQYQFIVDYKVMQEQRDAAQITSLAQRLAKTLEGKQIASISFDKGFYSKENLATLQQTGVGQIILPKKGKLNQAEKQMQSEKSYKTLRHQHSAVESNINMLEHHGLGRCMDKGIKGFRRYVGISVLSYNLHILGNILVQTEKAAALKAEKSKLRKAA